MGAIWTTISTESAEAASKFSRESNRHRHQRAMKMIPVTVASDAESSRTEQTLDSSSEEVRCRREGYVQTVAAHDRRITAMKVSLFRS